MMEPSNQARRLAARSMIGASLVLALGAASALAQQTTAAPGSPGATVTIDGAQIPAPPQRFRGKIEREAGKSTPYWPARIVPPKGAPNVLLIITDDSGYG